MAMREIVAIGPVAHERQPWHGIAARAWMWVMPFLPVVGLLLLWEFASRAGVFPPFLLPAFSTIVERIWVELLSGEVTANLGITIYRSFVGFSIAAVLGVAIGTMMVQFASVRWFFDPLVSVGFSLPKIAFLPIFILWLGVYDASKITMIAVNAIFPIIVATQAGAQGVDKNLIWSARSMGASRFQVLYEVILPAAMPQILTGFQIAVPTALITCIVSEILLGGTGIGGVMIYASRNADSPGLFAGIVQIAIVGMITLKSVELVRRRLLRWHPEDDRPRL